MEPNAHRLSDLSDLSGAMVKAHRVALGEAKRRLRHDVLAGATASDVAQSVLRLLLRRADKLRIYDEATFLALVKKLVLRRIASKLRYLRAEKRDAHRVVAPTTLILAHPDDKSPAPLVAAAGSEWKSRFEACLLRMRPLHRDVLRLRLAGHSHEEIAALLGITAENSFKCLSRARAELAGLLGESAGTETDEGDLPGLRPG